MGSRDLPNLVYANLIQPDLTYDNLTLNHREGADTTKLEPRYKEIRDVHNPINALLSVPDRTASIKEKREANGESHLHA